MFTDLKSKGGPKPRKEIRDIPYFTRNIKDEEHTISLSRKELYSIGQLSEQGREPSTYNLQSFNYMTFRVTHGHEDDI